MALVLPRFLVFKSNYNNQYLRYVNEDVQIHGWLQFSGEEVVSPYSKLEVENSKTGKGLVHLRCCYNNKYLVRQKEVSYWIHANGDEPEENQSKWSCTLFEPVSIDAQTIRLRHVQLGHYVLLMKSVTPTTYKLCAFANSPSISKDKTDILTIIDWESLLVLPKQIAFKGDNGCYLEARGQDDRSYLQFTANDIADSTVGNEVFTTPDGSVRIKSNHYNRFWRRAPNWILADSSDTTNGNPETLFWPVKVDSNIVALRNLGNNNFCTRLTAEGKTSCLNAGSPTINKWARLEVHELVLSRNIYNVDFRLMDARIYNQQVLSMASGIASNDSQESNTVDLKLKYTESKSSTWNASVSLKLGVKTTIQTGIPLLAEGTIEISAEFTGAYEWGNTNSTTTETETAYKVIVPPMSTVKVSLLATNASCDVPFSYSQSDTLYNGQKIISNMDDGVYTGINCFNFKYETKQEPL